MIDISILDFLQKKSQYLYILNCSSNFEYVTNLINIVLTAKYCDSDIDLGIMFFSKNTKNDFLIVDGKRRLISISLLLKALITKMSSSDDNLMLINHINSKLLKYLGKPKLNLYAIEQNVYENIINDEVLSYNDQQTEIYKTYEYFLDALENIEISLDEFYSFVERLKIKVYVMDDLATRDLFYLINRDNRNLNQVMLIKSYLADMNCSEIIDNLYHLFMYKEDILLLFLQCYLSPKFNNMITEQNDLYTFFVKYFEMIKKYQTCDEIINSIYKTAKIYKKMYNAEYTDPDIRNMFIKIISNDGRDTFSYLLELCEDYENNLLSKETLLEIGKFINTYINERKMKASYNDFDFSKMTEELNKLIYNNDSQSNKNNQ